LINAIKGDVEAPTPVVVADDEELVQQGEAGFAAIGLGI
jgi:hypothetical protein